MAYGYQILTDNLIAQRQRSRQFAVWQPPLVNHLLCGHQATIRGRGIDFEELRRYQQGDELRTIDWRVTAKTGQTHTKLYRQEQERPVFVAVDLSNSMYFGTRRCFKSVQAAETAALLAWKTLSSRDRIGGIVYRGKLQQVVKPRLSKHAVLQLFNAMHSLDLIEKPSQTMQETETPMLQITKELGQLVRPGSVIYLISDFYHYCPDQDKHLHLLKRHNDITALMISDPMERQLPAKKNLAFSSHSRRAYIDTSEPKIFDAYQQKFDDKLAHINQSFSKLGISTLHIGTEEDALTVLNNSCSKNRRRRP